MPAHKPYDSEADLSDEPESDNNNIRFIDHQGPNDYALDNDPSEEDNDDQNEGENFQNIEPVPEETESEDGASYQNPDEQAQSELEAEGQSDKASKNYKKKFTENLIGLDSDESKSSKPQKQVKPKTSEPEDGQEYQDDEYFDADEEYLENEKEENEYEDDGDQEDRDGRFLG